MHAILDGAKSAYAVFEREMNVHDDLCSVNDEEAQQQLRVQVLLTPFSELCVIFRTDVTPLTKFFHDYLPIS